MYNTFVYCLDRHPIYSSERLACAYSMDSYIAGFIVWHGKLFQRAVVNHHICSVVIIGIHGGWFCFLQGRGGGGGGDVCLLCGGE